MLSNEEDTDTETDTDESAYPFIIKNKSRHRYDSVMILKEL